MFRTVPGSSVLRPRSTREENRIEITTEDFEERRRLSPGSVPNQTRRYPIMIRNDTGADLDQGSCVLLGERLLSKGFENDQLWFEGLTADPEMVWWNNVHGITREPIPEDAYGPCQISGVCLAKVTLNSSGTSERGRHRFCYIDYNVGGDPTELQSTEDPSWATIAQIVEKPTETGDGGLVGSGDLIAVRILTQPMPAPPDYLSSSSYLHHASSGLGTNEYGEDPSGYPTTYVKLTAAGGSTGKIPASGLYIFPSPTFASPACMRLFRGNWSLNVTHGGFQQAGLSYDPSGTPDANGSLFSITLGMTSQSSISNHAHLNTNHPHLAVSYMYEVTDEQDVTISLAASQYTVEDTDVSILIQRHPYDSNAYRRLLPT